MISYKLSPSALNLLKECPRCFWLHHNKKVSRPAGPMATLPAGMDRILKEHFDRFMEKGKLPPELNLKGIKLFEDKELLKVWRANLKGIQWTDKKGNLFRGAVDNILIKEKKLIVLDYKTRGYPLKEDTAAKSQDQLNIYNFLLRKNDYQTEDYAYLLFYHPNKVHENGDVDFHSELIKMDVSVEDAEKLLKRAIKVLEGEMPDRTEECGFCKWLEDIQVNLLK